MDVGAPELQSLLQQALNGQEREKRERELKRLIVEVQAVISRKEFDLADAKLQNLTRGIPGDLGVLALQESLSSGSRPQRMSPQAICF
jgi:hypothetical protein